MILPRRLGLRSVACLLVASLVTAAHGEEIAFWGKPNRQCAMGRADAICKSLTAEQQESYRSVVTQEGSRYLWKSREGIPLRRVVQSNFTIFVAETGAGFIKVGPDGSYVEVVHLLDSVIGYWGGSDGR